MSTYKTIQKEATSKIIDRHSQFLGYTKPTNTEKEAISFLEKIKSKHWDAKHNAYAYIIQKDNITRYSDDGEPHGTAGKPILDILKNNEITNTIVVVTRYFGGILLGTGGLVRAYSSAAKLAINNGIIINMTLCVKAVLHCEYNLYGKVSSILILLDSKIENSEFLDNVKIIFYIDKNKLNLLDKELKNISSGNIKIDILGEEYIKIK